MSKQAITPCANINIFDATGAAVASVEVDLSNLPGLDSHQAEYLATQAKGAMKAASFDLAKWGNAFIEEVRKARA